MEQVQYDAKYQNDRYFTNCFNFTKSINSGKSTPYNGDLEIIYEYLKIFKNKNHTCLDIGGHIGTHAIPYSRIFKFVHTFEANYDNFTYLERNIKLNKRTNIIAYNRAVSNERKLIIVKKWMSENSGCFTIMPADEIKSTMETITIDELEITNVDFIKIDVEGGELDVLKGASNTIKKYKPLLQVELLNNLAFKLHNIKTETIINYITNILNYVAYRRVHDDVFFIHKDYVTIIHQHQKFL
tara:strand:+ start:584 stop:1306 length:723 start_codon:yes stop_codon:yes gene_type:complete